nr:MAG TPA: hypothetical protein [Herelleviridae sp.]
MPNGIGSFAFATLLTSSIYMSYSNYIISQLVTFVNTFLVLTAFDSL